MKPLNFTKTWDESKLKIPPTKLVQKIENWESWETHRSEEEQEAGEEEATTNRTDLKWTHDVDDDDDEDEDGEEEFEEVEVWLRFRDFIYSYYPCFSLYSKISI